MRSTILVLVSLIAACGGGPRVIPLDANSDLPTAIVWVNGVEARFLVDIGSNVSAITSDFGNELSLDFESQQQEVETLFGSAFLPVSEAESLSFSNVRYKNFVLHVLEDKTGFLAYSGVRGILGINAFARGRFQWNGPGSYIEMLSEDTCRIENDLKIRGRGLEVELKIDAKRSRVLLDSGVEHSLVRTSKAAFERLQSAGMIVVDAGGQKQSSLRGSFSATAILHDKSEINFEVHTAGTETENRLGYGFLKRVVLLIDFNEFKAAVISSDSVCLE